MIRNNKGFSIIELIAVIAIIIALSTLIYIAVDDNINDSKELSYNTLVNSIIQSTENYLLDNSDDYPELDTVNSVIEITLNDLVYGGYLEFDLIDARTDTEIPLTTKVIITVTSKNILDIQLDYE